MLKTPRRTSVYTLTVPNAPAELLDTLVERAGNRLTDRVQRPNGEAVVRFRCVTNDAIATDTATQLLEGFVQPDATLTIDLGVNKRVVAVNH